MDFNAIKSFLKEVELFYDINEEELDKLFNPENMIRPMKRTGKTRE